MQPPPATQQQQHIAKHSTSDGDVFWRIPPLPLLSEISSLQQFALTSLDDAAEDAVKVFVAWAIYSLLTVGLRQLRVKFRRWRYLPQRSVSLVLFCVVGFLVYPFVNDLSDIVGNSLQHVQDWLDAMRGIPLSEVPPPNLTARNETCLFASVLDDLTEDFTKLGSVVMQHRFTAHTTPPYH